MTDTERLTIISDNVTALMTVVDMQTDAIGVVQSQLEELLKWANREPDGGLEDALREVADALKGMGEVMADMPRAVAAQVLAASQ
jgi:hypothetical protein